MTQPSHGLGLGFDPQLDQFFFYFEFIRLQRFHAAVWRNGEIANAPNNTPIKVAIIDTGVDSTHTQIREAIESGKIFNGAGFPKSLVPFEDVNGHGTHAASVLLKTAPNALV